MKPIEVLGTIEEGGRVRLDEPVPAAVGDRVRLIVLAKPRLRDTRGRGAQRRADGAEFF
jgi:hypothetical protein